MTEFDRWDNFLEAYSRLNMKLEAVVNVCHAAITQLEEFATEVGFDDAGERYKKDLEEILNGTSIINSKSWDESESGKQANV